MLGINNSLMSYNGKITNLKKLCVQLTTMNTNATHLIHPTEELHEHELCNGFLLMQACATQKA